MQRSKVKKKPSTYKKFPHKDVSHWKEWIQRQKDQCTVMLQQRSETWHEERRKLFELLWGEVPSEDVEVPRRRVSFQYRGQAKINRSMEYVRH